MSRTKKIKTYDYGNVLVSTQQNCDYCVGHGLQLADDAPKPTIINLGSKFDEIDALSPCPVAYMNAVGEDQNLDHDYTTDFNNLNQYIYWIWGGITSGGLGIFKHSSGDVCFICSHGYYIKNNNTKGKYYLEYFYRMRNYSARSEDYKIKQVAFLYYNQARASTNLVNPFPSDDYMQYVQVLTNVWYFGNTTNPNGWHFWNRAGTDSVTDWYYYEPTPTDQNYFETNDLNSLFVVGGWSYGMNVPRNIRAYYPTKVWSASGNPYYQNTPNIYDDEYWELNGYQHQTGHWYGEIADDDEGGDGDGDDEQFPIPPNNVEDIPTNILDTGFFTLFKPVSAELRGLANFMFSQLTDGDAEALKKLLVNPLDYITCLNCCHFPVPTGDHKEIKVGGIGTTVQSALITNQFVRLNGGSIAINEYWGNYLDYAPYTKVQIHIPYCGTHELDVDMVMRSTLKLYYSIDLLSGSMVATLYIDKPNDLVNQPNAIEDSVIETYTGNVFSPVPIASSDYRNMLGSVLGIASNAVTSLVSGNPLPFSNGVANAVTNSKSTVTKQGSISNSYGYISPQEAFIIISRPCIAMLEEEKTKFHDWMGYPCNMVKAVEEFSGVLTIQKDSFWRGDTRNNFTSITDAEADELQTIMESGICV